MEIKGIVRVDMTGEEIEAALRKALSSVNAEDVTTMIDQHVQTWNIEVENGLLVGHTWTEVETLLRSQCAWRVYWRNWYSPLVNVGIRTTGEVWACEFRGPDLDRRRFTRIYFDHGENDTVKVSFDSISYPLYIDMTEALSKKQDTLTFATDEDIEEAFGGQ